MPNPKDTKTTYLNCPLCNYGEFVNKNTYTFVCKCQTNPKDTPIQSEKCPRCKQLLHPGITEESCEHFGGHYPGCHNVHLGCAKKKIAEIEEILSRCYWTGSSIKEWFESLGETK